MLCDCLYPRGEPLGVSWFKCSLGRPCQASEQKARSDHSPRKGPSAAPPARCPLGWGVSRVVGGKSQPVSCYLAPGGSKRVCRQEKPEHGPYPVELAGPPVSLCLFAEECNQVTQEYRVFPVTSGHSAGGMSLPSPPCPGVGLGHPVGGCPVDCNILLLPNNGTI